MLTPYLECLFVVIGKTEQGGFHAKRQQHQYQRHIGIDIGTHTIVARRFRHIVRIEWYQQIVKESAHDT